jgi:hypothetical protein
MATKVKYPRTPHLPWSQGATSDDRMLQDISHFEGKRVVVSIKMDGENTTMYRDAIHARSLDSKSHPSRDKIKGFWASIKIDIPEGWRICLENCTAKHSIHYTKLPALWFGISIWNEKNECLSWDETCEWFQLLGITPVPVAYKQQFDEGMLKCLNLSDHEGYVVRLASSFKYEDFAQSVAKYVRANHVQTDDHWQHSTFIENQLDSK